MKLIMLKNCYVDGVGRKVGETVDTDKWKILVGTGSAIKCPDAGSAIKCPDAGIDTEPKLIHRAKRGQS